MFSFQGFLEAMDLDTNPMSCIACQDSRFSRRSDMQRHVAIVHGLGAYSTLQCDICTRKYFDYDHFTDHVKTSPICNTDCFLIRPQALPEDVQVKFDNVVNEMMRPIPSLPSISINDQKGSVQKSHLSTPLDAEIITISDDEEDSKIFETSKLTVTKSTNFGSFSSNTHPIPPEPPFLESGKVRDAPVPSHSYGADGTSSSQRLQTPKQNAEYDVVSAIAVVEADSLPGRMQQLPDTTTKEMGGSAVDNNAVQVEEDRGRRIDPPFSWNTIFRRIVGKRDTVHCKLCKKTLKPHSCGTVDHAKLHLKLGFYSCKCCKWTCNVRSTMRSHLQQVHSFSNGSSYFNDYSDQYRDLIIQKLEECFAQNNEALLEHPGISLGKQLEASTIGTSRTSARRRSAPVALASLTVNSMARSDCDKLRSRQIKKSPQRESGRRLSDIGHRAVSVRDGSSQLYNSLSKRTASTGRPRMTQNEPENLRKIQCLKYSQQLIRDRGNADTTSCNLCKKAISTMYAGGSVKTWTALQHAILHTKKPVYSCLCCGKNGVNKAFSATYLVTNHLTTLHKQKSIKGLTYEDRADQFHEDIMAMLGRCYGKKPKICKKPAVLSGRKVNLVTPKHRIHLQEIIRRNSKSDHITCRKCNLQFRTIRNNHRLDCRSPLYHVQNHLQKPLFACGFCKSWTYNAANMVGHIRRRHPGMTQRCGYDYADNSWRFEMALRALVSECFDHEEGETEKGRRAESKTMEHGAGVADSGMGIRSASKSGGGESIGQGYSKKPSVANSPKKIFRCRFPNCGFATCYVLLGRTHERLMHK